MNKKTDGHKALKAVSGGAILRTLRYPFVMLSMAVIPRMMGDDRYGEYAYYMSVFLVLDIFSDIGFIQILGRFVPECMVQGDRQRIRDLLHCNFIFGLLITSLLIAGLHIYTSFWEIPRFPQEWVIIMSLQLLFTQIEGILFSFVYSLNEIERYSLKEVYRSLFTFVLVFVMYLNFGITGALWGLVLNSTALSLIAISWVWPYLIEKPVHINWSFFKPYLIFGIQFYIPSFFYGMLQRSGNIFVRWLTDSSPEVAYYDIANQFQILLSSFLGLILATLIPSLTQLHVSNEQERIDQWQGKALTYCLIIAVLAFNTLIWCGDFVIQLVFGTEFTPVYANAIVSMLAMVAVLLSTVGMNYALLKKEPGIYIKGVSLGLIAMVAGCIVFIPRWHSIGASWATLIGYCTLGAYFMFRYRQHFSTMFKPVAKVLLAGAILAPAYVLKGTINLSACIAATVLSSILFVALLFITRTITRDDATHLLHAFKK